MKSFSERIIWWESLTNAQEPTAGVGKASVSHMMVGFFICFSAQLSWKSQGRESGKMWHQEDLMRRHGPEWLTGA